MEIHPDLVYSHTEYDVTGYFQQTTSIEVQKTVEKLSKMLPLMDLGRIFAVLRFTWPSRLVDGLLVNITSHFTL